MLDLLITLPALHGGALHPYERLLVLLIGFGPFVVLAVLVLVVRRRDIAAEDGEVSGRRRATSDRRAPRSSERS